MLRLNPTLLALFCCALSLCHAQRSSGNRALAPEGEQAALSQALADAIRSEDLEGVVACIEVGVDVHRVVRDDKRKIFGFINDGWATPMHIAAGVGNVAIMEALYAAGADVREGFYQYFPHRYFSSIPQVVYGAVTSACEYLKDGLKGKSFQPRSLGAPIHRAAIFGRLEAVKFLLKKGEKRDRRNRFDVTPLHLAAVNGYCKLIKFLCRRGADCSVRNLIDGRTPQELAECFAGDEAVRCFDPKVYNAEPFVSDEVSE